MNLVKVLVIGVGVVALGNVLAQEPPSAEARAAESVDMRKSVLKLQKYNLIPMIGMAKGQVPVDTAIVERNATRIAQLAAMIPDVFSADTRAYDVETEALDVIWENMDDFVAKADDLVKRANSLAATAATGDKDATQKGIGGLGQGCGNCHDDFRVE